MISADRFFNTPHVNQLQNASPATLLSKFIDSIDVKFKKAEYREIIRPLYFSGTIPHADLFLCFNSGDFFLGKEQLPVQEGSFYFIPRGQKIDGGTMPHSKASGNLIESFSNDVNSDQASRKLNAELAMDKKEKLVTYVAFDTILYNAFPFFPLLDLPAFIIPRGDVFATLLKEICLEEEQNRLGKDSILKNYLGELVVHLFRFIESRPDLKKPVEKLHYLTDVRLINIVNYIQENLDKDLTNAAIAKVAFVSDDYVGQFFKALTGRTLQDYIEHQRLERAMHLLKTIPNSVQEVAAMVGFKDAAYFSRRFRMRFEVNANVVRQGKHQES